MSSSSTIRKATNADAAAPALSSYDRIYWIAGGLPKEGGITTLAPFFPRIAKAYLIGEAAADFAATLGEAVPYEISGTLERAVAHAAADAETDETGPSAVMLSPACASFDQYKNFEVRGDAFVGHVAALDGVTMLIGSATGEEDDMVSRAERGPLADWFWTIDRFFLAIFIFLMGIGFMLSFAASPAVAERIGLEPLPFRQAPRGLHDPVDRGHGRAFLPDAAPGAANGDHAAYRLARDDGAGAVLRRRGQGFPPLDLACRPLDPAVGIHEAGLRRRLRLAVSPSMRASRKFPATSLPSSSSASSPRFWSRSPTLARRS